MRFMFRNLIAASALSLASISAHADTKLNVLYAVPSNFKALQQDLAARFQKDHPDITITFRNPAETYDSATAEVLRSAIVGDMPDVYFQGLNQLRVLVSQGHAVDFGRFVSDPKQWGDMGYIPSMLGLGQIDGKLYGLPFSISTPTTYINEDLLKKAGAPGDKLPDNWADIIALGKKIDDRANGVTGFMYGYTTTGNWLFQALITSAGGVVGTPDGCKIGFNNAQGKAALDTLEAFSKGGMPEMNWQQSRQAFAAGKIGILIESSASVTLLERNIADKFKMRTVPYPVMAKDGKLPAGGNVAMILSKDPEKQKAAWEYVKFVTGPIGQTMMANYTGYAPGNQKAVDDPKLLGGYYETHPNHATGVRQLSVMTQWHSWAGQNSVKIVDVIQNYLNDIIGARRTAAATMPLMVNDVQGLLPASCP